MPFTGAMMEIPSNRLHPVYSAFEGDLCRVCRDIHLQGDNTVTVHTDDDLTSGVRCPICRMIVDFVCGTRISHCSINGKLYDHRLAHVMHRQSDQELRVYHPQEGVEEAYFSFNINLQNENATSHSHLQKFNVSKAQGVPETLNYDQIKCWIADCDAKHTCRPPIAEDERISQTMIFLVDIAQMCLTEGTTSEKYIALSYVRGSVAVFQLTYANLAELKEPGSLAQSTVLLNRIFTDAMATVSQLGERYIWIDALCIPQDECPLKAHMISQMDQIYSQASLTIVALSATSANSPLPGVQWETRVPGEMVVNILDASLDKPNSYAIRREDISQISMCSKYRTRGWTYQEECLSRRLLLFTKYQVFFCCQALLRSDGNFVHKESEADSYVDIRRPLLWSNKANAEYSNPINILKSYEDIVQEISGRELTFPSDALNAVAGILSALSVTCGWTYRAGIPKQYLYEALLWNSRYSSLVRNANFPSWSWAGWTGSVYYGFLCATKDDIDGKNSVYETVDNDIQQLEGVEFLSDESYDNIRNTGVDTYLENPLLFGTLRFWSYTTTMNLVKISPHLSHPAQQLKYICTTFGGNCGILFDVGENFPRIDETNSTEFELAAISRFERPVRYMEEKGISGGSGDFIPLLNVLLGRRRDEVEDAIVGILNVMLIKWKGKVAERVTTGYFHETTWNSIRGKRKLITLV